MDTLEKAQRELFEAVAMFAASEAKDGNAFYRDLSEKHYQQAAIYAVVAQAEQLRRIADATERRNELLAEYNAESKASADRHTASIATSVTKFVDAIYGESDTE